jgi:hypothetical protein
VDLIVAEKPSVARDIARVVGATKRGDGCLEGPSHVVTWCIGHLVELEEPAHYNPQWKQWRLDTLPMAPERFALRPVDSTKKQWAVVKNLLRDRKFSRVVNACDAGREGELIFRHCYELAGSKLPMARLWVSSLTDAALRGALAKLAPGQRYDPLGRRPLPLRGRLARRDERHPRPHRPLARRRRDAGAAPLRGPGADPDARDGGGARAGHPGVCFEGLLGGVR